MKLIDCKILSIERFGIEDGYQPTNAFFYVLDGCFSFKAEGEERVASANELVAFPRDMHFLRRVRSPLTFYYLKVDCEDSLMPRGCVAVENRARLLSTLAYLTALAPQADRACEAEHYTRDVFMQIKTEAKEKLARRDSVVLSSERYFEEHIGEKIALCDVAKALGVSVSGLIFHFKAACGITPMRRLLEMRMQRAEAQLLSSDKTLAEIAALLGFDNAFYFSNVFKKEKGISPSAYRRKYGV